MVARTTDWIVDASPTQVMAVIEQMVDLPWPEGDEWLDWEINGIEGQTNYLLHLLPLAVTEDVAALAPWAASIAELADRRWGARTHFDATRFMDDKNSATYDWRSAPASMVRALDSDDAVWWPFGHDAVVLVENSASSGSRGKAAVFVMPRQWFSEGRTDRPAPEGSLLADFLSTDNSRVLHAVWEVFKTRDPEILKPLADAFPAIDRATDDLELGGAFISNGSNLDHALDRIRLFDKGQFLCAMYAEHSGYEPAKEQAYGHIRIVGTVANDRQWEPDRICECTDCGKRFQVEQGESHFPWRKWTELKHA